MIADKETAVVGTINLDYRSLHLHFEDGVFLYKTKVIKELEEDVVDILKKSEQITEEKLKTYHQECRVAPRATLNDMLNKILEEVE